MAALPVAIASALGLVAASAAGAPVALTIQAARPVPESPVGDLLQDRTISTFDTGIGTQVEYIAADGSTVLWLPGREAGLRGTVGLRNGARTICFLYEPENPASDLQATGWQEYCHIAASYIAATEQVVRGDPLSLDSGAVPFVLPYEGPPDIATLAARAGIAAAIDPATIPGR